MKQFLMVRADALILGSMWQPDTDEGPQLKPPSPVQDGIELSEYSGVFDRSAYPETYVAHLVDGAPVWSDLRTMDDLRAQKAAAISSACTDAIVAGFACDALGAGYSYPSKPNDQANLTGSVVRSFYPNVDADWRTQFWCTDAGGAWEFRLHSATQIQHVGDCAVVARLNCMALNEQLQAQIVAAGSPAALAAINWPE